MNFEQQKDVVRNTIQTTPPPHKSLKFRFVPDNEDPGQQAWFLVLYLENFASHNATQMQDIVEWVDVILTKINAAGVPCGLTRIKENP